MSAHRGLPALLLAVLISFAVAADVSSAASGLDITAQEGEAFTKRVADIDSCVFDHATIDWGDGTSSAGQFDTGATPGVKGTHTYVDQGIYNGTVTYTTDCTTDGQVTFTATVGDQPLTASGRDIGSTAGESLTGVVSHFTDANPLGMASDFAANINWGDGTASVGTVSAASGGGFDVTGTHTYQHAGVAAVNVTIIDEGGSTASSSSTARIAATPLVASFTWNPLHPCSNVTLDASGSSGGTITAYEWQWGGGSYTSPTPTVMPSLGFSMEGPDSNDEYHFLRPPATVGLTVVDDTGRRSLANNQTITFAESDQLVKSVFVVVGSGWKWGGYYTLVPVNPGPCWEVGLWHRLRVAKLVAATSPETTPVLSAVRVSVTMSCPATRECGGTLALRTRTRARDSARAASRSQGTTPRTRILGRTPFAVPPSQESKVKIRLNKTGRRLARRHRLKWVELGWVSGNGKTERMRTVRVRRSPRR